MNRLKLRRFLDPDQESAASPNSESAAPEASPEVDTGTEAVVEDQPIVMTEELAEEFRDKLVNDGVDLTDAQDEAYDKWLADGKPKPVEAEVAEDKKPAEPVVEPVEGAEKKPVGNTEDQPAEDKAPVEGVALTTEQASAKIQDLVGAKDMSEVPEKFVGMASYYRKKAGMDGQTIKDQQTNIAEMQSTVDASNEFFEGLAKNDPVSVAHLRSQMPHLFPATVPVTPGVVPNQAFSPDNIPDDVIDVVAYKANAAAYQGLEKQMQQLLNQNQQNTNGLNDFQQNQQAERESNAKAVQRQQTETMVQNFVGQNLELVPAGTNVAQMITEYYDGNKGDPVNPNFQKVADLLDYSIANNYGNNLAGARTHMGYANGDFAKQLEDAREEGRLSALKHAPSQTLSAVRSQGGGDTPVSEYTTADIQDMYKGLKDIPDEWLNETGLKPYDQLPESVANTFDALKRSAGTF